MITKPNAQIIIVDIFQIFRLSINSCYRQLPLSLSPPIIIFYSPALLAIRTPITNDFLIFSITQYWGKTQHAHLARPSTHIININIVKREREKKTKPKILTP